MSTYIHIDQPTQCYKKLKHKYTKISETEKVPNIALESCKKKLLKYFDVLNQVTISGLFRRQHNLIKRNNIQFKYPICKHFVAFWLLALFWSVRIEFAHVLLVALWLCHRPKLVPKLPVPKFSSTELTNNTLRCPNKFCTISVSSV